MAEVAAATALDEQRLLRGAVLSVFTLGWLEPGGGDPSDEAAQQLADFLADSCERVVDEQGRPWWRLRDDERLRVFRRVPHEQLRAALDAAPMRPDEPVQRALENYLQGTVPPLETLGPDDLTALLRLHRWLGADAGLPSPREIQARLDWLTLFAPLRRLLARGFVGREDVLTALLFHVDRPFPEKPFVVEGVGGSGKSTILARLVDEVRARGDVVCYVSFDRTWLVQGGAWSLVDEIARQAGIQQTAAGLENQEPVTRLRRQVQRFSQRVGYSDVASRGHQIVEKVPPGLLRELGLLAGGRRLVLVVDTLEELARRDVSLAQACSTFLEELQRVVTGLRVVAAGRARPRFGFPVGQVWQLTGLDQHDGVLLLNQLTGYTHDEDLLRRIVDVTHGHPLSLHLAADVLERTHEDPTRLIAIGQGDIEGQLYSRLLEHIKNPKARAVAHPGLVVRRITPDVIREVLAEPCGIAPLSDAEALETFEALRSEATLCEPSLDGDGALTHRPDVRTLMLPAITRATPGVARKIHEAAVDHYQHSSWLAPELVARREELYHRLMLKQSPAELDPRWLPAVADELATVIDELPAESQLYLAGQVKGLRLDPEVRAKADDEQWRHSVRPAVESLLERGQPEAALHVLQERRGHDGRVLLPDLEIEALERVGLVEEALQLARTERQRASALGHDDLVRGLILQEARILERMRRFDEALVLLERLAHLDMDALARDAVEDDEVRTGQLVVLTSMARIARHSGRDMFWVRRVTADLAEATPARVLRRSPALLRDLAAEVGDLSPRILQLATEVRGVDTDEASGDADDVAEVGHDPVVPQETFTYESDASQDYT